MIDQRKLYNLEDRKIKMVDRVTLSNFDNYDLSLEKVAIPTLLHNNALCNFLWSNKK